MNYFAHGRLFITDPYCLAGTAIPDWLNVADRQVRVRARISRGFLDDPDPQVAALARGIVWHHADDFWFHQTRAFAELSLQLTRAVRTHLPADDGFRPSFLGHILVELLLDSSLIEDQTGLLDAYYAALEGVDPETVTAAVCKMTGRQVDMLTRLIPRFLSERFLCDYLDDGKLLTRLNHVMHRVRLPALPEQLGEIFPAARAEVRRRRGELLAGEIALGLGQPPMGGLPQGV
jgi:hypothetical protein